MENIIGFIQPVDQEMKEGILTVSDSEFNSIAEEDAHNAINQIEQEQLQQSIQEILNDPAVRANALANANDFKHKCKGWFTVEQIARKLMLKPEPVLDILNLLCLYEMAYRKEHRGELRYKIQLSNEDKVQVLEEELLIAKGRVAYIEGRILSLSNNK